MRHGWIRFRPMTLVLATNLMGFIMLVCSRQAEHQARMNAARARQDLDTIRQAILLHETQSGPWDSNSLEPLLGRYMREIPRDPWGNEYLLESRRGVLTCLGADGEEGGVQVDTRDIEVSFRDPVERPTDRRAR